jgi:hypothetical protein
MQLSHRQRIKGQANPPLDPSILTCSYNEGAQSSRYRLQSLIHPCLQFSLATAFVLVLVAVAAAQEAPGLNEARAPAVPAPVPQNQPVGRAAEPAPVPPVAEKRAADNGMSKRDFIDLNKRVGSLSARSPSRSSPVLTILSGMYPLALPLQRSSWPHVREQCD